VAVLASEELHITVLGDVTSRRSTPAAPQVLKFRSPSDLFKRYREGSSALRPAASVPLPAPPAAGVRGGATGFVARLADGSVSTWGAPIHGHLLGRRVGRDVPPDVPCALNLPLEMVRVERATL
jgi:hypothetical protein